jgi:hypothetical protein
MLEENKGAVRCDIVRSTFHNTIISDDVIVRVPMYQSDPVSMSLFDNINTLCHHDDHYYQKFDNLKWE